MSKQEALSEVVDQKALYIEFKKSNSKWYRQRLILTVLFFVFYKIWKSSSYSEEMVPEEDKVFNVVNIGEKLVGPCCFDFNLTVSVRLSHRGKIYEDQRVAFERRRS